jgi:hypothetical protein
MKNNLLLIITLFLSLIAIGYGTNEITKPTSNSTYKAEDLNDLVDSIKSSDSVPAADPASILETNITPRQ